MDSEQRGALEISQGWWLLLIVGISSVVAGAIFVAKPSNSLATLAVVFGIFLLIDGIIELIESLGHSQENRGLAAVVGILGIVIGIILIRHPTHAVTAIGLLIGIWLVATGAAGLARAIALGYWSLLRLVIAVLKIAVGIAIIADPHIGYATLAVLTGIWLIVNGISAIVLGLGLRSVRPEAGATPHAVPGGVTDSS
jgi:uncharacterized membrane protein HdeD (DUF308 family)